jgi:hypothetical protein
MEITDRIVGVKNRPSDWEKFIGGEITSELAIRPYSRLKVRCIDGEYRTLTTNEIGGVVDAASWVREVNAVGGVAELCQRLRREICRPMPNAWMRATAQVKLEITPAHIEDNEALMDYTGPRSH